MFEFLRRENPSIGTVFFRGNLVPRAEEFDFMRRHGVEITPRANNSPASWVLTLRHAKWGEATMICGQDQPPFDPMFIDYQNGLTDAEKGEAKAAGKGVSFSVPAARKNVLRDRKNLLKFMASAMGRDAVVALDHLSTLFWTREMLKEELSHDADLDIAAIFAIHAVCDDTNAESPRASWIHTHGLGELGAFDFDIVRPSKEFSADCSGFVSAMAQAVLEGAVKPDTPEFMIAHPGGVVRMVPAADFDREAPPEDVALRGGGNEPGHTDARSVLCEPAKRGLMSRMLGKGGGVRPSRFCSEGSLEGVVLRISSAATDLMSARAAATTGVFRAFLEEFREFELPALVKMGYPTDAEGEGGREHLWFEVHEVFDDGVDATLVNQPHDIASMRQGQRGRHPFTRLTDWTIMSPFGAITPSGLSNARVLRQNAPMLREMLAKARDQGRGA
ncbi:MAG: DUF4026 domain-containing protein [Planctomycetota bacterium]|nr:DUF4026 domain-containing protein [Planctomycetota bacterium]